MPVNVKEVKRRLNFLLKDENLVSEYIRRFGPVINMPNIKAIKAAEAAETEGEEDEAGKGEDPIFEMVLNCPVCNNAGITCYELKAKSQQINENRLLQQEYIGAMGHRTVDYDRLAVTVCPRCLFASPDKRDFVKTSKITGKSTPSQIQANCIITLQEKIGERKAVLEGVVNIENYFKRPRKIDAAVNAYKLAAMRAKTEAYHELPNSLFKIASYYLKIAKLVKAKGEDDTSMLRESLDYFVETFKNSNTSSEILEYRVIYLIIALYLKLGEPKKAHPYLGVFDKIHTDLKNKAKQDASINLTPIDQWIGKAKYLWEDRERDDLFD